ncbi:MAG TPA: hypothetical protein VN830_10860 [Verrucomicrobiae bacterium]|nr:hypothetical protein [Verrucomicrobiae bacterium]
MSFVQRRRFLWLLLLAGMLLIVVTARATTLVRLRFPDLVHYASAIARVRCVGADTRVENGEIFTDTRFHVLEIEKGQLPARIVVRQPGGKFQHLVSHVEGTPEFRVGEEVYLFLWGRPGRQFYVLGWSQGTFRVHHDALSDKETVTQDSAEIPVFDPEVNAFTKMGVKNLRIDVFQERIRREVLRAVP